MQKTYHLFHLLPDELLFLIASFLETPPIVSKQLYCAYLSNLAHQLIDKDSNSYNDLKIGNKLIWYLTQFMRMQTTIFSHNKISSNTSLSLSYLTNRLDAAETRTRIKNKNYWNYDEITQLTFKISILRIGLLLRLNSATAEQITLLNALTLNYSLKGLAIICLTPLLPANTAREKAAKFSVLIAKKIAFPPEMAAYISPTTFHWILDTATNHQDTEVQETAKNAFKSLILHRPQLCHNIDIHTLITDGKKNNYSILNIVAQHAASEFKEQDLQAIIKTLENTVDDYSTLCKALTKLAKLAPTLFKRDNLVSLLNLAHRSGSTYKAHLIFSLIYDISKQLLTLFDVGIITLLIDVTDISLPYLCASQGYETLCKIADTDPQKFSIQHIKKLISHTEKRNVSSYTTTNFDILLTLTKKRKYIFYKKIRAAIQERLNNTNDLVYIEKIQSFLHVFIDPDEVSSEIIDGDILLLTSDNRIQQQRGFNELNYLAEKTPSAFSDEQISRIISLCYHSNNLIKLSALKLSTKLIKHHSCYAISDFLFTMLNLLKDTDSNIRDTVKWKIIYHYSDALTSAHFETIGALVNTHDEAHLNTILSLLMQLIATKQHLFNAKCKALVTDTLILTVINKNNSQQAERDITAIYSFHNIASLKTKILSNTHVDQVVNAFENGFTDNLLYILEEIAVHTPSLLSKDTLTKITRKLTNTQISSYQVLKLKNIYEAQPLLFHQPQLASLLSLLDLSDHHIKEQCYLMLTFIARNHPEDFTEEALEILANQPTSSKVEAEAKSYLEAVLFQNNQYAREQSTGTFDNHTLLSAYQQLAEIELPREGPQQSTQQIMQQTATEEEIKTEKPEAVLQNNLNTFFSISNWIKPLAEWLAPGCYSIS